MTQSLRTIRLLACLACMSAGGSACDRSGTAGTEGITVRDSAGVEIVEHSAAHLASLPQWTIDTAPLVHIAGDAPANAFTNVRTVVQRANGNFIVVEARAREIREYSATGDFHRLITRGGKGPGEIDYVSRLQLTPEDSLIVFDPNQRRASVFSPSGSFVRQVTYPRFADGSRFGALGMLNDKRLIGTLRGSLGELVETDGPVRRTPFAIVRVGGVSGSSGDSSALSVADTVAVVPDQETYPTASPSGGKSYPDMDFLIFGRHTSIGVAGDAMSLSTNVSNEIEQHGATGVVRRIRNGVTRQPVSTAQKEQVHAGMRKSYDKLQMPEAQKTEILEYVLTQRRIADTFAFNETVTIGADSTIWVEDPRVEDEGGRKYIVYDKRGRAQARAEFPRRIVPHSLSSDRMLGVWLDGDDIPHVMLWKIAPAASSR